MNNEKMSRRGLLATAAGLLPMSTLLRAEEKGKLPKDATPKTAKEALERLNAGNKRFVSEQSIHPHLSKDRRKLLLQEQHPFATILGCSDSRVSPELVFDQGIGDLFVIRVAGNVIGADVLGSMQYAVAHLHTPLVVVLGHEQCGAVSAALADKFKRAKKGRYVEALIRLIDPALKDVDPKLGAAAQLKAAVEANVRWSIKQVRDTPEAQRALREKSPIRIVGAIYELAAGKVRWLDR